MTGDKESFKAHVKKHSKVPPKHCVICDEGDAEDFDLRQHVQVNVSKAISMERMQINYTYTISKFSAQRCEFAV